jgi:hypothetical protein
VNVFLVIGTSWICELVAFVADWVWANDSFKYLSDLACLLQESILKISISAQKVFGQFFF